MVEVIDAEVVEVEDDAVTALVPVQPTAVGYVQSGIGAIAALSDEEFEENIAKLKKAVSRARRMQEALLEEGTDYGSVKGVKRPFLHKPGAEKFEKAYGLATSYTVERHVGGDDEPDLEFIVHARVHLGSTDGPVVGEGLGSANSWETKYRYRAGAQQKCPDCGKQTVIKLGARGGRPATFWCGTRDGGCGHKFELDDPRMGSESEKVENADPWDLANTLLKMARKRAHVDGILTATGTSGLFTQDEDAPIVTKDEAVIPRATGPAQENPVQKIDGPGKWRGEVTKVDPESGIRQAKIEWLDKGKKAHEKVELKVKVDGRNLTVIMVDQLALAAANAEFRIGDPVAFDGEVVERIWQEGKPPIKEIRNPPGLWRFRGGTWLPIGPAPAATPPEEIDYAQEELEILEAAVRPEPTWQEKVANLKPMLVRQGEKYIRRGYVMEDIKITDRDGTLISTGLLGVPNEGIFNFATRESDRVGVTIAGLPIFDPGDEIDLEGTGNITAKGTHMLVVEKASKVS